MVRLHPHARERMQERGATEEEIQATITQGEQFPAQFERTGLRRNFQFDQEWRGRHYALNKSKPMPFRKAPTGW